MLIAKEIYYHIFREKARFLILICVTLLLCGCIAFYQGNIQSNEAALDTLSESIPVTVRIVNGNGSRENGINIPPGKVDALLETGELTDVSFHTMVAGAFSQETRQQRDFSEGDVSLKGVNRFDEPELGPEDIHLADGWDLDAFTGSKAVCLVEEKFARENGIGIGDAVSLPVYMAYWNVYGYSYNPLGELAMQAIGTYDGSKKAFGGQTFIVPASWLRQEAERAGVDFYYHYFCAKLVEPLKMNRLKERLPELGFRETEKNSKDFFTGDAIQMEDELFIQTARKLKRNVATFRGFQAPFFLLIIGLSVLAVFLALRGSRKDMAIASSLGRSKKAIAAGYFLTVLAASLTGLFAAFLGMIFVTGLSPIDSLIICCLFLVCSMVGTFIALLGLLRFDTLSLLS